MKSVFSIGMLLWGAAVMADNPPILLNQIQVIGTHNSYHVRPPARMLKALKSLTDKDAAMDYSHDPLDVQLDNGVRSFELDIQPFTEGFQVYHVPALDQGSTCPLFRDCLAVVGDWSQHHPEHVPISILLEFKYLESLLAGKPLRNANALMLELLEKEILSVIPQEKILTPDDVRGDYDTLSEAVRKRGWPTLEDTRGKLFFIIHNRELRGAYRQGRPSLEGRLMFINSTPDQPDCVFTTVGSPYSQEIPDYIARGIIIRVRADVGLQEGRTGDTGRRDAAFASGAHIITTDFPRGREHAETGYTVQFPDGVEARSNPVNGPVTVLNFETDR